MLAGLAGLGAVLGAWGLRKHDGPGAAFLGVLGAGGLALGVQLLALAAHALRLSAVWRAVAYAGPTDVEVLVVDGLDAAATASLVARGVAAVVVVAAVAGAVVLGRRRAPAVAAAALVLMGLGGAWGAGALGRAPAPVGEALEAAFTAEPLVDLDAPRANRFAGLVLGETLRGPGGQPLQGAPGERLAGFRSYAAGGALQVGLGRDASAAQLDALLREALGRADLVELVGVRPLAAGEQGLPSELRAAVGPAYREVTVALAREADACATPCAFAQLSDAGLVVDGQTWPLEKRSTWDASLVTRQPALPLRWRTMDPALLLRAAQTAANHQRCLQLVFGEP